MDYSKNAAENILNEIRLKTPKVQTLIGAGSGIVIAIVSIKIAESIALFVGGAILILSLAADYVWNPNINLNLNLDCLNTMMRSNGPLATGFIAGYLIGFALI